MIKKMVIMKNILKMDPLCIKENIQKGKNQDKENHMSMVHYDIKEAIKVIS